MSPAAVILAAFVALAPPVGEIEMSGARGVELVEAGRDRSEPAGPHAASRRVRLERRDGRLLLRVRWQLETQRPGWFAGTLAGGDVRVRTVTLDGKPAATIADGSSTFVAAWVDGTAALELVAELRGDPARGPVPISLLGAMRGTAVVEADPSWRLEATTEGMTVHTGGVTHGAPSELQLVARTPGPADTSVVVHGRVGVGLFVGDAETRGRARLQWVLRRGELTRVSFVARDVGEDFTVVGPDVREVARNGEIVQVELLGAVTSVVDLTATWSRKTPPGDATMTPPSFELGEASRTEASFELGRDGDVDVVPDLDGWRQVASPQLPTWGRDLIDGSSSAAWTRHGPAAPGVLQLLRFVPVEAPKVVVGEASFELASADHGVTLIKARYEVLNERASHLRVTLPAATRALAVEVAGADARLAADGDVLLVPIPRSLETMQGLVAIPVVVSLVATQPRWRRRAQREIALPTIDAPIRAVTARWLLPRDIKTTSEVGEGGIASIGRAPQPPRRQPRPRRRFKRATDSSATLYDFDDDAAGDAAGSAAPMVSDDMKQAETDRLLREAQESYNRNEFDDAQLRIDELRDRGLDDEDADKLQSNLDIVNAPAPADDPEGRPSPIKAAPAPDAADSAKTGMFRRIKDQARARGQKKMIENDLRKRKAKELRAKGDYEAAEAEYRQVIEDNRKLEKLEQDESVSLDFETEALEKELESTKTEKAARESIDAQSSTKFMPELAEPAEFGMGASWLGVAAALDTPTPVATTPTTPANFGPRVLMPNRGGDVVVFAFDLWAPGSRHALVVDAKRRRHRF